jgi:hypothetical protein
MRPVAAGLIAFSMMAAAPPMAGARDGEYDPCRNKGVRRIAVVYARSSGLIGGDACKGSVYPSRKTVCQGDTVQWSVVNTCDVEEVTGIRIEGLDRVAEKCTVVPRLGVGGVERITCRLRRRLPASVRQEYEVAGRILKSRTVIDPELDIRRPD